MEVETSRVHGSVYHRSRVHSGIRCSKGSDLVASTIYWLLKYKQKRPAIANRPLRLSECNTSHQQSRLPRKDEAYSGAVSSHPQARNGEEARSPENRHRLPDEATPRSPLWNAKDKDGAMTSDRAKESQTRDSR